MVAYSHTFARPDKLRQIGVERMMGKTSHLCGIAIAFVVAFGEGYSQHARCLYGIFAVCFVEVAATEKQQGIGMFGLERVKLLHHGG